jgi:uncharacterized NAD(P)/FAD-binding protein YdhS
MDTSPKRIGIVGAGFTGTMLAVHLLELSRTPIDVVLIDRAGAFGPGTAYSTPNGRHLLNVRVANMSAYDADPYHFIRWLWRNDRDTDIPPSGHAFVSRGTYGAYLQDVLEAARHEAGSTLDRVAAEVRQLHVDRNAVRLDLAGDRCVSVDCAVLCVGNFPPALPMRGTSMDTPRYVANPWKPDALAAVGRHDPVVLIGTGLTMVDVVLELVSRGHRGQLTALSRRGFMPASHREVQSYHSFLDPDRLPDGISELVALVRREVREAARLGFDWRSVVDAMRPHTQALWRNLPLEERRRFLRHVRPYWEIHRHRMAPQVAAEIGRLRDAGRLVIVAGRIQTIDAGPGGLRIAVRRKRDGGVQQIDSGWMVNCSGPELDYHRIDEPLIRSLFDTGLARPDALSLGLDVSEDYRLIDDAGVASSTLFALGPPIRGALWETTAVPDIRKQCVALARRFVGSRSHTAPA